MKHSTRKGFSFGLASGITTTMGLVVGLNSSTHSVMIIIGGILIIAIADSLSDAMGIHISEESEAVHTTKQIWESTAATFISKFAFALSFIVPILFLPLQTAIVASIIWGLSLIAIFSFYVARREKMQPHKVILEHITIAVLVIIATHYIGQYVAVVFG